MTRFEKHVQQILEQMQSPADEREEIRQELLTHLKEAKHQYMDDGLTEKQAEKQALNEFGVADMIGHQLQESMYPFQRGLLYVIGLGTILYGVMFYLYMVFFANETIPVWLIVQLLSGSLVTLAAINISFVGRYFYVLNLVLLVNVIWSGINVAIAWSMSAWQAIFFGLYLLILIAFGLIAVIRNSYYSSSPSDGKLQNRGAVLISYAMNLLFGAAVTSFSLFFLWAILAFSGAQAEVLLVLVPIIIWLVTYKFQMTFIPKKPLLGIASGFGFAVLSLIVPYIVFLMLSGRF